MNLPIIDVRVNTGNAIHVDQLNVRYGSRSVLKEVCLSAPPNRITALVGPSGCGKSTFLSCINRMTDLLNGCVVDGLITLGQHQVLEGCCDLATLRRTVGMVFQNPNPFPMSIRKNIAMPLKEHQYAKSEIDGRIEFALRQSGLWDEVKDRFNDSALQLSGGQQQRLCIARALALEPSVMLFDEPCSALDPVSSDVVENLIESFRGKMTVLIVTHNLRQARRIADNVAVFWMRDDVGTIVESGSAEDVFSNPQDPDAAAFLNGRRG